jgi:lysophospholipase L1-like esterase
MKKKILIISSAIFVFLVVYLFAAHHHIYREISAGGLKFSDQKGEYFVGAGTDSGNSLVYTAIGDSLTAGVGAEKYEDSYPYQIAQKLSGNRAGISLRDRAYPGARTSDVVNNLLNSAINDKPDIITLLIGVNDIHGLVSKKKFTENYSEILRRLKGETKAKIFTVSVPYIGTDSLLLPPYAAYFKFETKEYNQIIKALAQSYGVEYVDLYSPTENMFETAAFCASDSFHPSARGYALWAEIIYADINHKSSTLN